MALIPAKETILVVDDSAFNLRMLENELQDRYRVLTARSGAEALSVIGRGQIPDLILLDVVMPDMDGYEVCRLLKGDPDTRDIPVIFITSMDGEDDEERGLLVGAIDYIRKPYSLSILRVRIQNHLELKRYRDILKKHSMIDGLTGIPNRRLLDETLDSEIRRARRARYPLGILMADIDFFKRYNDLYGHLEGDECLKAVAMSLQDTLLRPADFVARWGGEEFVCLLPEQDEEGVRFVAQALLESIRELEMPHGDSPIGESVTISVGGTVARDDSLFLSGSELLKLADVALYEAKEQGRNRAVIRPASGKRELKDA